MNRQDALKALEIYRRAGQQVNLCQIIPPTPLQLNYHIQKLANLMHVQNIQAERLSEFYEICKSVDVGRGERFIKIEQVGIIGV